MNDRQSTIIFVAIAILAAAGVALGGQVAGSREMSGEPGGRTQCPILSTCADPVEGVGGLAYDGTYIWAGDYSGWARVSAIDPATCTVARQIPATDGNIGGLAWDGSAVWVCYEQTAMIQRLDPNTGAVLTSFAGPGHGSADPDASGLAWDGTYLWHADYGLDMIYRLDPHDGTVLQSFPSPGGCPGDIEYDPASGVLVVADCVRQEYVMLDPADGSEVGACGFADTGQWGVAVASGLVWTGNGFYGRIRLIDVIQGAVATTDATWGTVKALYR